MAKISVDEATVNLTEVTLSELNRAVKKAKEQGATRVNVRSEFSRVTFSIDVAVESNMMESMGYQASSFTLPLKKGEEPIQMDSGE